MHIRSTNVIESTFAMVRLRTDKTRGCGTRLAMLTMVFKLAREAQKAWKKPKRYRLIAGSLRGIPSSTERAQRKRNEWHNHGAKGYAGNNLVHNY